MKKILFLFGLLSLLACKGNIEYTPSASQEKTIDNEQISNQIFFTEKATISAHRAGKNIRNYPENCLETMEFLKSKGISNFEIDIFQSADGQIMLMHDERLGRTATGSGVVESLTSTKLRESFLIDDFKQVTDFKIPFFKDVLTWAKQNNAFLMIDFKKGISYEKIVQMIRESQMQGQVALISYSVAQAQALHKAAPEMLISVMVRNEKELDKILGTQIPRSKMIAFTGTVLSSAAHFKRLNSLKIPAILGTLGNLDRQAASQEQRGTNLYKQWESLGIQIFSTNRPLDIQL